MPSLSILVPKLLPQYCGVAKVPLPEGLVCFVIVSLHELEWILMKTPDGGPNDKRLVQFFLKSHKVQ